jgi:hypothetical protein
MGLWKINETIVIILVYEVSAEYTIILSAPADWGRANVGAVPWKLFADIRWYGNSPLKFAQVF